VSTLAMTITVNGKPTSLRGDPLRSLLDVLREDLGLTGAKDACGGEGECGACTVLLDGEAVNACLVLAGQADGRHVETIEGLAAAGQPHPVQAAFVATGAVQCGYCTAGAVLSGVALLRVNPDPGAEEIRQSLIGNLCRCTGYGRMVTAILDAAERLRDGA
jgi:aerobic carbon-monoxide dehydrogenase small subunit